MLISFRNNEGNKQAANLYGYCLAIASLLFLCGIIIFYLYIGNTDIMYINGISSAFSGSLYYLIALMLIILAFIIMLGIVPFLNIYEKICDLASFGTSAYLTIIPVCAYIAFLSKFFVFLCSDNQLCRLVILLTMTFAILCNIIRLIKEENIKNIYSVIAVINSALLIIIVTGCSVYSISAVILGLFAYIFAMSGLWCVSVMLKTRYRSDKITDYKGLFYARPYFSLAYILCIASVIGLPPSVGFIARIYEFTAFFKTDMQLLYFAILLICLFSLVAFCYVFLRLIKYMFQKNNNIVSINKMFIIPKITLYLCAFVLLLLFIYPDKLIKISQFIAYYI
jgi:NADH-quinone oxidoreductase subunit N